MSGKYIRPHMELLEVHNSILVLSALAVFLIANRSEDVPAKHLCFRNCGPAQKVLCDGTDSVTAPVPRARFFSEHVQLDASGCSDGSTLHGGAKCKLRVNDWTGTLNVQRMRLAVRSRLLRYNGGARVQGMAGTELQSATACEWNLSTNFFIITLPIAQSRIPL